jgi:hypothetical protein
LSWRNGGIWPPSELGVKPLSRDEAIRHFTRERLQDALVEDDGGLVAAFSELRDVCIETKYNRDLYDFYILRFAYDDLEDRTWSDHERGATRENIIPLMRDAAQKFIQRGSDEEKAR